MKKLFVLALLLLPILSFGQDYKLLTSSSKKLFSTESVPSSTFSLAIESAESDGSSLSDDVSDTAMARDMVTEVKQHSGSLSIVLGEVEFAHVVGSLGRLILLRGRGGKRHPAVHTRGIARRTGCDRTSLHRPVGRARHADRPEELGGIPDHGAAQQHDPLQSDRVGASAHRQRSRIHPQRHHTFVHGRRSAFPHP